ncbi:hypothetical protein J6590_067216 [Homalodisca vitripennis]|nr:hypothetical protein J6590_067216 [Homalodisca vitripennis]
MGINRDRDNGPNLPLPHYTSLLGVPALVIRLHHYSLFTSHILVQHSRITHHCSVCQHLQSACITIHCLPVAFLSSTAALHITARCASACNPLASLFTVYQSHSCPAQPHYTSLLGVPALVIRLHHYSLFISHILVQHSRITHHFSAESLEPSNPESPAADYLFPDVNCRIDPSQAALSESASAATPHTAPPRTDAPPLPSHSIAAFPHTVECDEAVALAALFYYIYHLSSTAR